MGDRFDDYLLLSDGWGDLLLVLGSGGTNRTLEQIFEIQAVLFEDFQVDRTELILTRECLHEALAKPRQFRISLHARLLEDRTFEQENTNFEQEFWERIDKDLSVRSPFHGKVSLHRVPGRMDYVARINTASDAKNLDQGTNAKDAAEALLSAMAQDGTDRMQTAIVLNAPGKSSQT